MARWLALIVITQQVACGGKAFTTAATSDPAPVASVTISPSSAQVSAGGNVQFIATVQNASSPAVTWEVNGIPGGNSSVGTITPAGAATASYVAPASVPGTAMVTVSAVLQANGTTSGSATVTVNPSSAAQISVSPASASVVEGTSLQFNATVQNGPQAVIWLVNNINGGNSTFGTVSSSGFYIAPVRIPNPSMVTITALLATNSSISGSTSITIVPRAVSVSISPSTANLATSQTLQFAATAQNSNASVVWEVNGIAGGDPALGFGTITSSGSYTAPANVPSGATVTITAVLQTSPPVSASAGVTIVQLGSFTGVYSWRNDSDLTGQNSQETALTLTNLNGAQFGKLFRCPVDGQIYAQPLYVSNVAIPNLGTHNVVYVATEHDSVYAFDGDATSCQVLWQVSFIDPAAGVTTVPASDLGLQQDIVPEIGITGTPVIDPATATLYVVAKTKEDLVYVQRVHALDLTTGAEKFGAPVVIQAKVSGTGDGTQSGAISFDALTENQRSALTLASGNVYIAFDSYEDTDPVHGWLFAYNSGDLTQAPVAVFNSTPNGSRGGIGESGAAPSSDGNGNIFVATSDGTRQTTSDYPETLLRLQTNSGSGFTVADSFAPPNPPLQPPFTNGVLLLPTSAGSAAHPNLAIAGSQAGSLYLLDRDNLTKDGALQTLCLGGSIMGTPAYWANAGTNPPTPTVYVAAAGGTLQAFPLANGSFSLASCPSSPTPSSQSRETFNAYGASPVISSNGNSNGIVWALDNSGYAGAGTSLPAILHAYDATNLTKELYSSPASDTGAAGLAVKFAVPTIANGKVYVGTQSELSVFGLLP